MREDPRAGGDDTGNPGPSFAPTGQLHPVTLGHVLVYQQAVCDGRQAGEALRQVLEQTLCSGQQSR